MQHNRISHYAGEESLSLAARASRYAHCVAALKNEWNYLLAPVEAVLRCTNASPLRRQTLSSVTLCREKIPASMTAKAVSNASDASGASGTVTNLRCLPARRGFPSGRWTPARHLPGSRSKARTINPLYSTLAPRRSFRRCEGTTTLVSGSFQYAGESVVLCWILGAGGTN